MNLKTLTKRLALAVAVFAGASSASAGDYDWSGPYIGMSIGSDSQSLHWAYTNPAPANCCAPFTAKDHSTMYDFHLGYQHQFGMFVVGVEGAMIEPGDKFTAETGCIAGSTQTCKSQIEGILTLGPRLGISWNHALFYGDGGFATGQVNSQLADSNGTLFDTTSRKQNGWYAGGGVEYALTAGWVAGLEYQHIDLGTDFHPSSADSPGTTGVNGRRIGAMDDEVRARISYKFHSFAMDETMK